MVACNIGWIYTFSGRGKGSDYKETAMSTSVLVGFATRYGSTQEVAEVVAAALRESGLEAKVEPMKRVHTLEGHSAVVLGAPLYIGSWPADAKHFLTEHQAALSQRPLAVFALGPLSVDENEMQGARAQLDKELAKYPALKPVEVALFAGKFDPKTLRFPDSLLMVLPANPLHGRPASDQRDWTAIRAWAGNLAAKLKPANQG
jgi:menaquinone-dependent protoporphyrinogen oxidase